MPPISAPPPTALTISAAAGSADALIAPPVDAAATPGPSFAVLLLPGTSISTQFPITVPPAPGESAEASGWPDWSALGLPIDPAAGSEDPELLALLGSLVPQQQPQTGDPQAQPSGLSDLALWTTAPLPMAMQLPQTVPTDTTVALAETAPVLPAMPWMPAPASIAPLTTSPAAMVAAPSPELPMAGTAPAGPPAAMVQASSPIITAPSPFGSALPTQAVQPGVDAQTMIASSNAAPATPEAAAPAAPAVRAPVLATPSPVPQAHPETTAAERMAALVPSTGMPIAPPPTRPAKAEANAQPIATDVLGMTGETIAVSAADAPAVDPGMPAPSPSVTPLPMAAPTPTAAASVTTPEPATVAALPTQQMAAITPRASEPARRETHGPNPAEAIPAGVSTSEEPTPPAQPPATFTLRSEPVSLPRSEPVVRSEPNPVERAVAHQVSRAIIQHLPDGGARMVMRLTPPELGTVRIEFLMRDGVVTARLLAEDDGVRQALDRALPQMRNEVRTEHPTVDITVDRSDQRQSWQDGNSRHEQRHDPQGGNERRPREGDEHFSLDLEAPQIETVVRRVDQALGGRVSARAVDAFA
jgi:flagellar hook-length control protein FliK